MSRPCRFGPSSLLPAIVLACVTTLVLPAHADPERDVSVFAGGWVLNDEFSDLGCRLALLERPEAGGFAVEGTAVCTGLFPILETVTGWRPQPDTGGLAFVDKAGRTVVEYAPGETDALLSVAPNHIFQRLIPADSSDIKLGAIGFAD